MDLDPVAAVAGVGLIACDRVGSTNAEALERARAGERGPLWITARAQTAGRGRRGRTWVSEPGNLYATLLLTDPSPADRAPELSFVAALAVHDSLVACAPSLGPALSLKWPNDVLCGAAKIAGILVEGEGTDPVTAAVGIGINCARHPEETDYAATDLAAAGALVSPEGLFRALSRTMLERLSQWDRGNGFPSVRTDWVRRAAGRGADIRVRLTGREIAGRFEALDPLGRLVVRLADGTAEIVAAGEVFAFGPAERPARVPADRLPSLG
ncbi:MAG TPA: biotin--[acetyl-CoA-carboxylase] ligase [Xanthobacteraceae bacterium]|jgi:BirA family biotin operon repressor/biotin-[acetyl-CoA-carboxylase] ligase|nr:biotin--[acetyl-CoA-carboxylase] ligase [Xanthobacteraceae bacterium]